MDVSHPTLDLKSTKSHSLDDKRIVLCVTGSIAAVETVKLARELIRHGADVQGVMSQAAQAIISPYALEYATGRKAITEITGDVEHVAFCGRRKEACDLLLIAPCTANTIGKIASGIDDTPVTTFATTAIGSNIPIIIVPAMHGSMFEHAIVKENIRKLESAGIKFIMPKIEEGAAKMPSVDEIVLAVERTLADSPLKGLKALITGGPNFEAIDPIRVLTSRSTGRMGEELALEAYRRGADVTVVHRTKMNVRGIRDVFADGFSDMKKAVMDELGKGYDIYISAAAISDFTVDPALEKLSSEKPVTLKLKPAEKLLDRVRHDFPGVFIVAFKAESLGDDALIDKAFKAMDRSMANLVVANKFGGIRDPEYNDVYIIKADGGIGHVSGLKSLVAGEILDAVSEYFQ
ncbi:MAG TPA: bifunctional phosphopantothenoylcysteine decarboxylase/phosphopantothenate--cysteine ligase CoaBC [Methanocella sp.]|uniref:bifunctional phosphopantothenoylcysteine decarboxylase/phosphopantothenate--cysteine ligase CoaBC n=1 Tax=Methanocella sp. TaxID=2052833 RepID=UPI002CBDFC12|nr:bifunctional phosphopantothenoylcysteine decarboxylase/phosphopantothenate--cysteine ligase CoaBC [Methanocella sp.]HTY90238.1 bifunctional phosphopantothenoylcysteine decarboxylase/phosphopantothenate--cysteine ligase CoaBC [Methanocella sp.]